MSIKISLKNSINEKQVKNYAVFSNENFKINALNKILLNNHSNFIINATNNTTLKKITFCYLI